MIVKNIVIRHENNKLMVDVKDADLNTKKLEQKASVLIDIILEEILKNKDTFEIINKED